MLASVLVTIWMYFSASAWKIWNVSFPTFPKACPYTVPLFTSAEGQPSHHPSFESSEAFESSTFPFSQYWLLPKNLFNGGMVQTLSSLFEIPEKHMFIWDVQCQKDVLSKTVQKANFTWGNMPCIPRGYLGNLSCSFYLKRYILLISGMNMYSLSSDSYFNNFFSLFQLFFIYIYVIKVIQVLCWLQGCPWLSNCAVVTPFLVQVRIMVLML